jgi:hypothetical protein
LFVILQTSTEEKGVNKQYCAIEPATIIFPITKLGHFNTYDFFC